MACAQCNCGREDEDQENLEAALTAWVDRHPNVVRGSVPQGKVILNDALAPLGDIVERADAEYPARSPLPDGRE